MRGGQMLSILSFEFKDYKDDSLTLAFLYSSVSQLAPAVLLQ